MQINENNNRGSVGAVYIGSGSAGIVRCCTMKSAKRKMGGAWRRKKRALSLHAKQGKDRSRQNRQDRSLEEKVKIRGLKIEKDRTEDKEKTV